MQLRLVVDVLRALLILAVLVLLGLQVAFLPWLSGVMAEDLPAEAFMRWPILVLAVLGLLCVQVVIVCTVRLLGLTRADRVFSRGSLRWVDGIVGGFVGASLVCLATIGYHSQTVAGPPLWMLGLWGGVLVGVGLALLTWTMRVLLVQATTLRSDMDMVI